MNFSIETYNCLTYGSSTKRLKPFRVARYVFNYMSDSGDRKLLDAIIASGIRMATKVNPGAANNAALKRDFDRIVNNCIAGVLSEYLWKKYLNADEPIVDYTKFDGASNQVDLLVLSNNKKIEVRSSFPRNGIRFALCSSAYEFDVIGMYSNGYKPTEIQKDYYVRALFHLGIAGYWQKDASTKIPIMEKMIDKMKKDNFEAFLTGGATWDMMLDNKIARDKNFIPEDEININRLKTSTAYRVVPFSSALDTVEMMELIKAEK